MNFVSTVSTVADEAMIVSHIEEGSTTVVFPVSYTVSDHETLELGNPSTRILSNSCIDPSVQSQSELRDIDASI